MIKNAHLGKEIVVEVVNKIGILSDICKLIAEHGINIEAVAGYAVTGQNTAKVMLVTDDNLRAGDALKKSGYKSLIEREVVVFDLDNKAGALKLLTGKLAEADIDIRQIYATACPAGCPARVVVATSDNDKALVTFRK